MEALLEKYVDTGIESLESMNVLQLYPINSFGTSKEIVDTFGGKSGYKQAVEELEDTLHIYWGRKMNFPEVFSLLEPEFENKYVYRILSRRISQNY
ncbi:MAG: type I restriction-modification enzyme R subunit C-terminal domain-containing protein [Methylobacter sp.]|nr:type I restriction-modification enzyme R subunit C-terminal domain-containing protein [Methylobacter sp.]